MKEYTVDQAAFKKMGKSFAHMIWVLIPLCISGAIWIVTDIALYMSGKLEYRDIPMKIFIGVAIVLVAYELFYGVLTVRAASRVRYKTIKVRGNEMHFIIREDTFPQAKHDSRNEIILDQAKLVRETESHLYFDGIVWNKKHTKAKKRVIKIAKVYNDMESLAADRSELGNYPWMREILRQIRNWLIVCLVLAGLIGMAVIPEEIRERENQAKKEAYQQAIENMDKPVDESANTGDAMSISQVKQEIMADLGYDKVYYKLMPKDDLLDIVTWNDEDDDIVVYEFMVDGDDYYLQKAWQSSAIEKADVVGKEEGVWE